MKHRKVLLALLLVMVFYLFVTPTAYAGDISLARPTPSPSTKPADTPSPAPEDLSTPTPVPAPDSSAAPASPPESVPESTPESAPVPAPILSPDVGGKDGNDGQGATAKETLLVYAVPAAVCAAAAAVIFVLIKRKHRAGDDNISQLDDIHADPRLQQREQPQYPLLLFLTCRGGFQDGREYFLDSKPGTFSTVREVKIGRAPDNDIRYPDSAKHVSRHHAVVKVYRDTPDGRVELTDLSSTATYLKKGSKGENKVKPLPKNIPVVLEPGDAFYVGTPENRFELTARRTGLL